MDIEGDSRKTTPRNWDEYEALQVAIGPTVYDFMHLTEGQIPTYPDYRLSYSDQMLEFQDQLNHNEVALSRPGRRALVWLDAWFGGITTELIAPMMATRWTAEQAYGEYTGQRREPVTDTLGWVEANEVPFQYQLHQQILDELDAEQEETMQGQYGLKNEGEDVFMGF